MVQVRDMFIGYKNKILYDRISFDIKEGDCIMLCGANGSGKTTLLNALEKYGRKSGEPSCEIIMIPARIPKVAGFTTREFIRIACFRQSDMGGRLSHRDEAAICSVLNTLGLTNLADRDISTLSDGEFQKAAIASALVRKADIIMLDEPTAFLDAENRISILNTLRSLCDDNHTAIIFSTHDLHDGMSVCTKVFALGADKVFRTATDKKEECIRTIFRKI